MHPEFVRRVLIPAHERLLGRRTLGYLRELESSQWLSLDELRRWQVAKLKRLLRHAHRRCAYYREQFDAAGIDPDRTDLNGFEKLPTLSRSDLAAHAADMIDPTVSGGLFDCSTGGSTGSPVQFKIDRARQAADQAARARSRRWFGVELGERELYLWGSPIECATQDRVKALRDRLTNQRLLSAFEMTPARMTGYLKEMDRFKPVHIFGYPSSLARLCRHAAQCGMRLPSESLRAVFVTGEWFNPADREIIEETVRVPVADGYGARDAGFVAHQCPAGTYHVTMESLIVELLDDRGRPVGDGEPGEITTTHLDAFGMPFIRYRTGDIARRLSGRCPCGRGLESLKGIEGRRTDMLRTADGGFAHALSVIYVLRDDPAVAEFKLVQSNNLDLNVQIVPRIGEAPKLDRIDSQLRARIGERTQVRISLVPSIPPAPSGKHRYVVSEAD